MPDVIVPPVLPPAPTGRDEPDAGLPVQMMGYRRPSARAINAPQPVQHGQEPAKLLLGIRTRPYPAVPTAPCTSGRSRRMSVVGNRGRVGGELLPASSYPDGRVMTMNDFIQMQSSELRI